MLQRRLPLSLFPSHSSSGGVGVGVPAALRNFPDDGALTASNQQGSVYGEDWKKMSNSVKWESLRNRRVQKS